MVFVASRKFDIADSAGFAALSTRNVLRVGVGSGEDRAKIGD